MSTPHVTLFVVAAPAEGHAVARAFDLSWCTGEEACPVLWRAVALAPGVEMVVAGVGKANAAAAVARVFDPARHAVVVNIGLAGALPRSGLDLLDLVVADPSVYADEGVRTPDRFIDIARCGFAPNQGVGNPSVAVPPDSALRDRLAARLKARVGPVATVSTCSGRNGLALRVAAGTGAIAEVMEGAAVGFTMMRLAREAGTCPAFAEVRVISNTTGNRSRQRWDLDGALARVSEVARVIAGA